MTCREFADQTMDAIEGTLPRQVRAAFDDHMSSCRSCARHLALYREAIERGKAVFRDADTSLPPQVPADLLQAILAVRRSAP